MIGCLQGYNIYLQYNNFVETELSKINPVIYQSIDEELNLRTRITKKPDKIGTQHSYLKMYEPGEVVPVPTKGESITDLDSFDVKKLKTDGFVNSQSELITLILQDSNESKGRSIKLAVLDTIFVNNLKENYEHSILLLDKRKKLLVFTEEKTSLPLGFFRKIMQ